MKRRRLAILSAISALFLSMFGTAPVSASPDTSSDATGEKVLNVAIIGDSYTAGNGAGGYVNDNADGSFFFSE